MCNGCLTQCKPSQQAWRIVGNQEMGGYSSSRSVGRLADYGQQILIWKCMCSVRSVHISLISIDLKVPLLSSKCTYNSKHRTNMATCEEGRPYIFLEKALNPEGGGTRG